MEVHKITKALTLEILFKVCKNKLYIVIILSSLELFYQTTKQAHFTVKSSVLMWKIL